MGTWGIGLYSNDEALDIRDSMREMASYGWKTEDMIRQIIQEYELEKIDSTTSNMWLAFADTAWRQGRMTETLKETAISIIDQGIDMENWQDVSPSDQRKRMLTLEKLKDRLQTPQRSKPVKYAKMRIYDFPWKAGEVYAFPSDEDGLYHAVLVIDNELWKPNQYVPDAERVNIIDFVLLDWRGKIENLQNDLRGGVSVVLYRKVDRHGNVRLLGNYGIDPYENYIPILNTIYQYVFSMDAALCKKVKDDIHDTCGFSLESPFDCYEEFKNDPRYITKFYALE